MLLATKVLLIVVISHTVPINVCNNPICLQEAAKMKHYINPNINPCEDFYQFACGNFLKSAGEDENLGYLRKFKEERKREFLKIYQEPIQDEEHKMVKAAKKLFNSCMNETEIQKDNLETIKKVLKTVGGWPVVEGNKWNESKFDWLQASYKFRELGYYFSSFLELEVLIDPDNKNQFILSVKPPNVWDANTKKFNNLGLMTDVALIFGAENIVKTGKEMIDVQDFLSEMQKNSHSPYYNFKSKFTVERYQKEYKYFHWLEFINKMARGTKQTSKHDTVMFPAVNVSREWFRLLAKIPKRTQANYMIWKVIQEVFPYLTLELQKRTHTRHQGGDRKEFCLKEIEMRFVPSPIGIIYDRRHLSQEKVFQVQEQMLEIKSVLVDVLNQTEWIEEEDKRETIQKVKEISLIFGIPGNSSNDEILDDLEIDMDMMENKSSNTFLSLLAEAKRNRETTIFNLVGKSLAQTLTERWYVRDEAGIPLYSAEDNIIYIPTVALEGSLFYKQTPRYLNYGALGYQFGGILSERMRYSDIYGNKIQGWSKNTKEVFGRKISCLRKELEVFQLSQGLLEISLIITQSVGHQISYMAYKKWVESNGEESKLNGLDYTPEQLFWISAATMFCQPISFSNSTLPESVRDPTFIANIVSGSKRNIPDFAKDFNCPLGSKMNPPNRCNFVPYIEDSRNKTIDL